MPRTVQISVPIPGDELYSYSVPGSFRDIAHVGKRVLVPFGNRRVVGFVVGYEPPPEGIKPKDIIDVIDAEPLFGERRLAFFRWISKYYMCSLGSVLKAAHPGVLGTGLKRKVVLTKKGEKYLGSSPPDSMEQRILSSINLSDEITAEKLFNLVEDSNFAVLNGLKRKELIDYKYEFKNRAKKKLKRVIRPVSADIGADGLKSKPAKRSIMEYLVRHGKSSTEELKELFSGINNHLKWLENNGYVKIEHQEVIRDPFRGFESVKEKIPVLNKEQEAALKEIERSMESNKFSPYLLNGVTGSGKTEIYLRTIEVVLNKGMQAIVLVPEISLTPQLVKRFKSRFGNQVAVIHSMLSEGERFDAWRLSKKGEIGIVIGARSAIFAPFDNIGVIIVDEEHESTYKQDENPSYNARDVSLVLGSMMNSTVILGSATPSVESYQNAVTGKFGYLTLSSRARGQLMPEVEVIDMRKESNPIFSRILKNAVIENYRNNNQTILFLNRRGYSSSLVCEDCGNIFRCPNCNISLTYHKNDSTIKCHYCGLDEPFSNSCKECGSIYKGLGIGTQTVEQELANFIPGARIYRMDRDSAGSKLKLMEIYNKLENNSIDVLIGTQMVAKGHDLPGVTLVGVISADMMLTIPDFRSGEKTFQLITQVAGRSGRGDTRGTVIVQTYNQDHPSIRHAVTQDSVNFLEEELKLRESLEYPPFTKMVNFRFTGKDEIQTRQFVEYVCRSATTSLSRLDNPEKLQIVGPSRCPIYKMKNSFRWQMILKSEDLRLLHAFSRKLYEVTNTGKGRMKMSIDVDPQNFY